MFGSRSKAKTSFIAVAVLSGCGGEDLGEVHAQLTNATCEAIERCNLGYRAPDDCESQISAQYARLRPVLEEAISQKRIEISEEDVGTCVEALEEGACGMQIPACARLYRGTVPAD